MAEKIGDLLTVKPGEVDEGYFLSKSLEIYGEKSTWDALREAGATNSCIEKYRAVAAESTRTRISQPSQSTEIASLKYEQLFSELPTNKPYLLWMWGERASDKELELAAKGLIGAMDSKQQLAHLRIFARKRFPLDPSARCLGRG